MDSRVPWQTDREQDVRRLMIGIGVSFGCHLVLFVGLIAAAGFQPTRRPMPGSIRVTMVSLPGPARPPAAAKPASSPPPAAVPEAPAAPPEAAVNLSPEKPRPKPKPKVSLKKKTRRPEKKPVEIKKKESLKKKTYKPARVVKRAIDRLEKEVQSKTPDPLAEALARIENSVGAQEATGRSAAGGPEGAGGARMLEIIDIYRTEIAFAVQANWAFSEQLAGGRPHLEAKLAFRVLPSGAITDIRFDQRSGNRFLDESARKAIVKSDPVPPHPQGINKSYVMVGLRFTPEGVR